MSKFCVKGEVTVKRVTKRTGTEHVNSGRFDRMINADSADEAKKIVMEAVRKKWMAESKIFRPVEFRFDAVEVFEMVIREEDVA